MLVRRMNHPVKRYKPNEDVKVKLKPQYSNRFDWYASHYANQSSGSSKNGVNSEQATNATAGSAVLETKIKCEPGDNGGGGNLGDGTNGIDNVDSSSMMQLAEIKKEPDDNDENGKNLAESLFTSEGLQASYKDLDQLFDEENSGSSPLGVSF